MTRHVASALALAVSAFAATALLWRLEPQAFPYAWLAALSTWIGAPLGCLGLLLIHAITGGRWGYVFRAHLDAGVGALLLLPAFFVLVIPFARTLYPWLRDGGERLPNAFYLNESGALARALCYALVWFGLGWVVAQRLRRPDADSALAAIAPAGLILLTLTITFMSIDLVMSLEPLFSSSVFGLLKIADMALFALSLCIFAVLMNERFETAGLRELSRLLLAAVILWAYLAFMELLIVWQSNLPAEASWYAPRLAGGWGALGAVVTAFRFVLPFFMLLSRKTQTSPETMRFVAAMLIAAACAGNLWVVGPQSQASPYMLSLSFAAALTGMAATTFALIWYRHVPGPRMDRV